MISCGRGKGEGQFAKNYPHLDSSPRGRGSSLNNKQNECVAGAWNIIRPYPLFLHRHFDCVNVRVGERLVFDAVVQAPEKLVPPHETRRRFFR